MISSIPIFRNWGLRELLALLIVLSELEIIDFENPQSTEIQHILRQVNILLENAPSWINEFEH